MTTQAQNAFRTSAAKHGAIIGALVMRELITRFGRRNIGFLWLLAEPLIFCGGIMILWSLIKPEYEHGIRLAPFLMTGYLPLLMLRHMISQGVGAVRGNASLLYHRQISLLHVFIARGVLEVAGTSLAFAVVYAVLGVFGAVSPPHDLLTLYAGWALLAWLAFGISLPIAATATRFEAVERIVPVFTYLLVPLSGVFFMVAWIPPSYREIVLTVPIVHTIEMIRSAVFGEFVPTYYDPAYVAAWAGGLTAVGLLLLLRMKNHLELD